MTINDKKLLRYIIEEENFSVEYELEPVYRSSDERSAYIEGKIQQLDKDLNANAEILEDLKTQIYNYSSHADKLDLIFSACSGVLCGLIDVFFVGKFDLTKAKEWSNKKVNEFVIDVAQKDGYSGNRLNGAIQHLEQRYQVPNDSSYVNQGIGVGSKSHHLDDMAHHPSIVGLVFSMLTQFTGKAYFSNKLGHFEVVDANTNYLGDSFPDKIFRGFVNWFFHLVSDMSGSSKTAGVGMGIPGPVLSFAKEISSLPLINKTGLPEKLNDLYQKNHFDLRTELAIGHELKRQAVPVVINEVLVRGFYFIRRFIKEYKEKGNLSLINWKLVLPFKNATITRMMTVASGAFLVVDVGDAALRAKGNWGTFFLHINFVNIGRFTLAVCDELSYAYKRAKAGAEYNKQLLVRVGLYNVKIAYQQYAILLIAKDTLKAIQETYQVYVDCVQECEMLEQDTVRILRDLREYLRI